MQLNDSCGEAVHAVCLRVYLKPTAQASEEELRAHCRKRVAGYKCPKTVEIRETLPMTAAGKILKRDLREPYWQSRE
ncbi:acyl-CoA synthetase (AMP-forming)/AMP-acid ligase II [Metapseudomonas resinovorans]|uniref:AMP-binding enzyme n=1 Tax=Metapseudomonas resinovorans TaxID=53412 RepID=UPI003D2107C3